MTANVKIVILAGLFFGLGLLVGSQRNVLCPVTLQVGPTSAVEQSAGVSMPVGSAQKTHKTKASLAPPPRRLTSAQRADELSAKMAEFDRQRVQNPTATRRQESKSGRNIKRVDRTIYMAASKAAYDELIEAIVADDDYGRNLLILSGQAFLVHSGTKVRVLDLSIFGSTKVRIVNGKHAGRLAWTEISFLK